jgi:hypothetical protein
VLPAEPSWSELDALDRGRIVLTEPALTTLAGMLRTTLGFVDQVAAHLVALWRRRRENPGLIVQPSCQWPRSEPTQATGFRGFEPGTAPDKLVRIIGDRTLLTRFVASGLNDVDWHSPDTEPE